jgi:[ribosomal protein S18]-alanine N-acetyltransferase
MLTAFQKEDAPEIVRWAQSLEEARAWAGATLQRLPDETQLMLWHSDPSVHPFVLRRRGAPVAYGELWVDEQEQEIEIARIIVAPSMRNRGVGRRLVTLLVDGASSRGLEHAFVRAVPGNSAAIRCYVSAGFERVEASDACQFNREQPVRYVWLRCRLSS